MSVWTVELTDLKLVGDDDDNDIDVPEYDEMTVRWREGGWEGGREGVEGVTTL